ncbi:MAG: hypothetical protein Ct9H90mP16_03470 [Candidatus Poseidoniales archaeon]|nr:MAG: hypothetical protein Ct9H90mP16_03470 [Candidatus Poseidoniales archaeon]
MFNSKNGNTASDWVDQCPVDGQSSIDTRSSSGEQLYPGDADYTENNAFSCSASHYIIGDYWYTSDLYDDFDDVSTSLHRQNARYAIARDLLTHVFSLDELVDLYHDLTSIDYEVATYEGGPGETIVRNNDIRYFAVDNRLYPVGGYQYAESGMHYGNPTGIFYAPTTLSGLDPTITSRRNTSPQKAQCLLSSSKSDILLNYWPVSRVVTQRSLSWKMCLLSILLTSLRP